MSSLLPPTDHLSGIAGPVFRPGDPGYAHEVRGPNTAHVPTPAVVVGATRATDVAAAVRFAAGRGLRVTVQATGHGLRDELDGTVLVSTPRMTGVTIDPVTRTARVRAGTRWRSVIDAAAPYGLAPLNPSSSGVGVVGYTTGGGLGPMARRHGYAADHVRTLTLVTADGTIRAADAERHPDLFWAARGGRDAAGIVTGMEFGLVSQPRFYGGGILFPGEDAHGLVHAWRAWARGLPEDATTSIALRTMPPDSDLPPSVWGRYVVHLRFAHLGSALEGAALLGPMRQVGDPLLDLVAERPYPEVDAVHLDPVPPLPVWDRGTALRELPAEAVDALLAHAGSMALVELRLLGGALSRPAPVPNAVAGRDAAFSVYCLGVPSGPDGVASARARAETLVDALAPWASHALPNLLGHAPEGVESPWSGEDGDRLRAIRRRYDPDGVFGAPPGLG